MSIQGLSGLLRVVRRGAVGETGACSRDSRHRHGTGVPASNRDRRYAFRDGTGGREVAHRTSPDRGRPPLVHRVVRLAVATQTLAALAAPALAGTAAKVEPDVGVSVLPAVLTVDEGRTGRFAVVLQSRPTAEVEVRIRGDSTDHFSIGNSHLRFTPDNWDQSQTVTMRALEDDDAADDATAVTFEVSGCSFGGTKSVTATARTNDDEKVGIVVTPIDLTVDEGRTASFAVALTSRPASAVIARIWRDSIDHVAPNRIRLRFTPHDWDRPQTVRLHARQDSDAVDDVTILTLTASGGDYDAMEPVEWRVWAIDDEERSAVVLTPAALTVDEGDVATYTVELSARPPADVSVRVSLEPPRDVSVDRTRLEFTPENWNTPQDVTVTAYDDADAVDDVVVVTHVASGGGYEAAAPATVAVQVNDEDRGLPAEQTVAATLVD